MLPSSHCDRPALESYLAGHSSPGEQEAIEQHLSDCSSCRSLMHKLAADETFWLAATEHLGEQTTLATAQLGEHTPVDPLAVWGGHQEMNRAGHHASSNAVSSYLQYWLELPQNTENTVGLGKLAHYEILSVVDQGGMGLVLKAHDQQLGRTVAIKTLAQHMTGSQVARDRFFREAQVAASLRHDNIVDIYSVSSWRDVPYFVMPFIELGSLRTLASTRRRFEIDEVLQVAEQLSAGLAHAHSQQVVHRDIKPSNILLDGGLHRVLIADFGLARAQDDQGMTTSGVIAGTPSFMSPEQARGQRVTWCSDLFSLGCVLFWMAAGKPPFESESCYGTIHKIIAEPHPAVSQIRSDFPAWFDRLLDQLLVIDPLLRNLRARHLCELVRQCRQHVQSPAEHPLPLELQHKQLRSKSLFDSASLFRLSAVGAVLVCLLLGIGAWAFFSGGRFSGDQVPPDRLGTVINEMASGDQTSSAELGNQAATPSMAPTDSLSPTRANTTVQSQVVNDDEARTAVTTRPSDDGNRLASAPRLVRTRSGPLDDLDLLNALSEIPKGIELEYWLNRLEALPPHDIPTSLLPTLEKLADESESSHASTALRVLEKNPFVSIDAQADNDAAAQAQP